MQTLTLTIFSTMSWMTLNGMESSIVIAPLISPFARLFVISEESAPPRAVAAPRAEEDALKELGDALGEPKFVEEMQKTLRDLGSDQAPDEAMDEFRKALMDSFVHMANTAEGQSTGGAPVPDEADGAMVEGFLKDVLSKDVLYEPMKEMRDKYPEWLAANAAGLPTDERERFTKQFALVQRICTAYERDDDFDEIAELMEQISALGQAPADMLAEISPGDAPNLPENCSMM